MAEPVQKTDAGGAAPGLVASGSPVNEASKAAVAGSALETVPRFGGNRGGRPRTDGLVPGSKEAIDADRIKETQRKAEYRARIRAQNPPALPLPSRNGDEPNKAPVDLAGTLPAGAGVQGVPWDPQALKPLVEELIPAIEQQDVKSLTARAAAGQLPASLLKEIERDARWPNSAKVALTNSVPRCAAKWANKFGISAEYQDEAIILTAAASIYFSRNRLASKIDKLAEQLKQAKEEPAKKP